MSGWHTDRGLAVLINQWRTRHPGAKVGTIADKNHKPPSDHLPEKDGSVDAADFMPGGGVTDEDLDELAETLRTNRDRRIAYVIRRNRIFSSTVQPWVWRTYTGTYHGHTHVSVNDLHSTDITPWEGITVTQLDDIERLVKQIDRRGPDWHLQNQGKNPRSDGRVYGFLQVQEDLRAIRSALAEIQAVIAPLDYDRLAAALLRHLAQSSTT